MTIIIDYGMGNVGSIHNMIRKAGYSSKISNSYDDIMNATKLILPGVGSFDSGMNQLNKYDLIDVLNKKVVQEKTPILGICLGMQLMTNSSEEGTMSGLGWVDAATKKFILPEHPNLKVPHMGWNHTLSTKNSSLTDNMDSNPRYYFVHSYYVHCHDQQDILTSTQYGIPFTSSFQRNNIFGVQFHPEKSHKYGLKLLSNFMELSLND